MLQCYSLVIFLSAFLLFSIQPLVGKIFLPILGGTPAVWNVCMVFFQAILFAGYFYAERLGKLSRKIQPRMASAVHVLLWGMAAALVPHALPGMGTFGADLMVKEPAVWLLGTLLIWIGVPFFVLSSTSTVIQNWFSLSGHRDSKNPYFLYAASNAGSMLALLAYPFLIEPNFPIVSQIRIWKILFFVLGVAIVLISLTVRSSKIEIKEVETKVETSKKMRWILYALLPSSLLLGVTTYISTDVASIPLFWIVPMILYLLSFILVYSRIFEWIKNRFELIGRLIAFGSILCIAGIVVGANHPPMIFVPLHLFVFFLSCIFCHGKLADLKPEVESLGTYYLCISIGGVAGGMINSLLAPMLFNDVLEYPLVMMLVCSIRGGTKLVDWKKPMLIFLSVWILNLIYGWSGLPEGRLAQLMIFGIPIILVYRQVKEVKNYAVSLLAFFIAANLFVSNDGKVLFKSRTFFGTIRVTEDQGKQRRFLFHGSTQHGEQKVGSIEPLSYYHPKGPAGDVFRITRKLYPDAAQTQVGIVGMGAGSLAGYARKSETWTFYELDPGIVEVATNVKYFTYLADSEVGGTYKTILGDARLKLNESLDRQFSLLVMDAFSSDSIPVHLITEEAVRMAWSKVVENGLLAFHISNRYFNLVPVMASVAASTGSVAFVSEDPLVSKSKWVILAREGDLPRLLSNLEESGGKWTRVNESPTKKWTDDYFDLITLLF